MKVNHPLKLFNVYTFDCLVYLFIFEVSKKKVKTEGERRKVKKGRARDDIKIEKKFA